MKKLLIRFLPIILIGSLLSGCSNESEKVKVTWYNYDNSILKIDLVKSGTVPEYDGETPTHESTSTLEYTFSGWTPSVEEVYESTSYYATYTSAPKKYNITWLNDDNSVIKTDKVEIGQTPNYTGETPKKSSTDEFDYTFKGWEPAIVPVNGDATYKATFTESSRIYTITWLNEGTVLDTQNLVYGVMPEYSGPIPTKQAQSGTEYVFSGWEPAMTIVTGNATYRAKFVETSHIVTATWKNYDGSTLSTTQVTVGNTPAYNGDTPTRPIENRTEYTFSGWQPIPGPITENTDYIAQYTEHFLGYIINFNFRGGTSSSPSQKVVYSLSASDFPYDVVKEGYNFRGWSYNGKIVFDESAQLVNHVDMVNNMTFYAEYSNSAKLILSSSVKDEPNLVGGSVVGSGEYLYHQSVTIVATPFEGYSFVGWYDKSGAQLSTTPEFNFVMFEKDTILNALFQLRSYTLFLRSNNADLGKVRDGDTGSYQAATSATHVYTKSVTIYALNTTNDYEFLGWFNENDERVSSNAIYTFTMPHHYYTLEAKWDKFTYHIYNNSDYIDQAVFTFDSMGGSNVPNQNVTTKNALTFPIPTKNKCLFRGWSWQKYRDDFYDFNPHVTEDTKLYARWSDELELDTYKIIVDPTKTTSSTSMRFYTYLSMYFQTYKTGPKTIYLRDDYSSTSVEYSVVLRDLTTNSEIASETLNYSTSFSTINFNSQSGHVYELSTTSTNTSSKYLSYYFSNFGVPTGNTYTVQTGNISLGDKLNIPTPTKRGYTFKGYKDQFDNFYTDETQITTFANDLKLVRCWEPINYNLNYSSFDATIHDKVSQYNLDSASSLPTNVTLDSLVFEGWYLNNSYTGPQIEDTEGFYDDVNLYGKLAAKGTVYFQGVKVNLYMDENEDPYDSYYIYNGGYFVQPTTPMKSGYVFTGWYTRSGYPYDFTYPSSTSNIDLIAHWSSSFNVTSYSAFPTSATSISNSSGAYYYVANFTGTMTIYYENSSSSSSYGSYVRVVRCSSNSYLINTYTYSTYYSAMTFDVVAGEIYRFSSGQYGYYTATLTYYFSGSGTMPSAEVRDYLSVPTTLSFTYKKNFYVPVPTYSGSSFSGYYYLNGSYKQLTDNDGLSLEPYNFTSLIDIYYFDGMDYRLVYAVNPY